MELQQVPLVIERRLREALKIGEINSESFNGARLHDSKRLLENASEKPSVAPSIVSRHLWPKF